MRSDNRKLIILSVAMPLGIALLPILMCLLSGCAAVSAAPTVSDYDLSTYKATVAMSAVGLDKPDDVPTPGPGPKPKVPRSQCKVCNGTGKCRSGDGLLVWDCTACEPDAKVSVGGTEEIPFGTVTYHRDGIGNVSPAEATELTEGKPTRKATGQEWMLLRAKAAACDCQTTGLCDCGDDCSCPGPRTRIAYLYTTAGCVPCGKAKEAIKAAAKSGRLPGDVLVVVKTDAPSWVRAFPTIHFQAGMSGPWVKTHEVETLLRDINGLKAGLAAEISANVTATPVVLGTTSGAIYMGSSVGQCGECQPSDWGGIGPSRTQSFGWPPPARSWGGGISSGWSSGWSGRSSGGFSFSGGGGGCANCGR